MKNIKKHYLANNKLNLRYIIYIYIYQYNLHNIKVLY